jgi:hypothetical protein
MIDHHGRLNITAMTPASQALGNVIIAHKETVDRVSDLDKAVAALQDASKDITCALWVGTAVTWGVKIMMTSEFALPFFQAELIRKRDEERKMREQLDAATSALQAKELTI